MKKKFLKLIIYIICLLTSSYINPKYLSPAEENVDRLMMKIEKNLVEKYNLKCIGDAVGMPGGIVEMLGLRFQIKGPFTKEQIRPVLISIAQDFVKLVNEDQGIKPYLERFPFELKNLNLAFFILSIDNNKIEYPNINIAGISSGDFSYISLNVKTKNVCEKKYERESYEEALKAVQEASQQDKRVSLSAKNESS